MGDRYPFSGDRPLVPSVTIENEENVVWSPESAEHHISMYQDVSNTTLSDTVNEGYVTAEDDDNATQYLSVLDATSEISLENLNITLDNSKMTPDESAVELFEGTESENVVEANSEDLNDQQVVVYSMEGSDELYGIQVSQDEDGNIIKYQFQFRKNDDGQLEAIPESIQLLPMDENDVVQDDGVVSEEMVEDGSEMKGTTLQHISEDDTNEDHEEFEEEDTIVHYDDEDSQSSQANIDIKPTILQQIPPSTTTVTTASTIIKQEGEEQRTYEVEVDEEPRSEETADEEPFHHLGEGPQFAVADPLDETSQSALEYQTYEEGDGLLESAVTEQLPDEDEEEEDDGEVEVEQDDAITHSEEVNVEYINEDSQASTQYFEVHREYDEDSQQFEERVQQVVEENRLLDSQSHFSEDGLEVHSEDDNYEHVEVNPDLNLSQDGFDEDEEDEPEPDDEPSEHFLNGNESDNEAYQIVNGMHITGDLDVLDKSNNVNILKQALRASSIDNNSARHMKEKLLLYVVQQTEKENVDTGSLINAGSLKTLRANPRSILKSSFGSTTVMQTSRLTKDDSDGLDERMNKRFARGKEAIQARIFHNFINKTTIPQEPVRKKRLPRKQQIKPVDRVDEEIIVQEMMVSSNGFVEADTRFKKGKLKVTEYVDLADSDDEYDPKKATKKKKKNKKTKSKVVDDSDDSVIEVNTSEDEGSQDNDKNDKNVTPTPPAVAAETSEAARQDVVMQDIEKEMALIHQSPAKRRRGRPSKKSSPESTDDSPEPSESPLKKPRVDATIHGSMETPTGKTEIQCPKCTKTFPSQNSLKTHLQHHSLQNTLKQQQQQKEAESKQQQQEQQQKETESKQQQQEQQKEAESKRQQQQQKEAESKQQQQQKGAVSKQPQKTESKYQCEKCNNSFKNNALLIRHVCAKGLVCGVCKRKFSDFTLLNAHKRTHAKEALVKSTTVAQISPMKMKASSQVFKLPKKTGTLKCKHCGKLCSSVQNLNIHLKSHKEYTCATCSTSFVSRMMLDSHVMGNCVKVPQKNTRRSTRLLKPASSPKKSAEVSNSRPSTAATLKVACSDCPMQFFTHKAMFQHKVAEHGLQTPDKSVLVKGRKPLHQAKPTHGGVRANERLREAYAKLRSRMVNKDEQQ